MIKTRHFCTGEVCYCFIAQLLGDLANSQLGHCDENDLVWLLSSSSWLNISLLVRNWCLYSATTTHFRRRKPWNIDIQQKNQWKSIHVALLRKGETKRIKGIPFMDLPAYGIVAHNCGLVAHPICTRLVFVSSSSSFTHNISSIWSTFKRCNNAHWISSMNESAKNSVQWHESKDSVVL